uniref:Reverse gyrase n=1 Tax=Ignisphaera aggregans TaxID=334771 RepID=A0A7C2VHJ1_9CREN
MSDGSELAKTVALDAKHLGSRAGLQVSLGEAPGDIVLKKLRLPRGLYLHLCPNCGGPIEDNRLVFRNACSRCMKSDDIVHVNELAEITEYLKELNNEGAIKKVIDVRNYVEEFKKFFIRCVGGAPWNLQLSWAVRLAQRQSFALIAPTGVGKTTFGLVTALYLAYRQGKKSYIVVPTTVLVRLYEERIREFMNKAGIVVQVIALHSRIPTKKRIELENAVREGAFDILITTSKYLQKRFEDLFSAFLSKGHRIDFLLVDDVDAIMKGSKAVDLVLRLIGFREDDIENGYRLTSLRQRLAICETSEGSNDRSICYEDRRPVREVFEELQKKIAKRRLSCGILIISSATGRARGRRVKLFRELLGFNIGSAVEVYRNVVDTYTTMPREENDLVNTLANMIARLGDGVLIYVPVDKGLEYAYKLKDALRNTGIEAEVLSSKSQDVLDRFVAGELKVLIGVATYYGLLVRGIDIPEKIRYAIFVGIPRHKISLTKVGFNPQNILRLLTVLSDIVKESDQKEVVVRLIARLRRILRRTPAERLRVLVEKLNAGEHVDDAIAQAIVEAQKYVSAFLSVKDNIEALKQYSKASIVEEEGTLYILIPDAPTYIQASGRISRLFVGGITTGLSVILVDDERLLNGLIDRVRLFIEDFLVKPLDSIDLNEVLKRIDEDRKLVMQIKSGERVLETFAKELKMKTTLFIVESPNKARTIASFFGRPTYREFDGLRVYETNVGEMHLIIASTGGHVFELVEEDLQEDSVYGVIFTKTGNNLIFLPKYDFIKRCLECGTQFVKGEQCPVCGSSRYKSSKNIVEVLQRIALEVDEVMIATDPDAEGEKIGYDIAIALAPYAKSILRAEFHEVTRRAVLNALRSPRGVDILLVEAQITRRIEDRWLGFALSEYVTYKLRNANLVSWAKEGRLSAGRVQTPVLGRIIETYIKRMRTLRKSKLLYLEGLVIEVPQQVLEEVLKEDIKRLSPSRVEVRFVPLFSRVEQLYPPPPFTTDEMIAEAHRVLRLDAADVMRIAQDLFELGFITYHRTDSTRISSAGIAVAKEYLTNMFGDKHVEMFEPRTWGIGGAHEGIRPTRPVDVSKLKELIAEGIIEVPLRLTVNHFKLYDLIFRRFIASQMKHALVERTEYLVVVTVDGKEVTRQTISIITDVLEPGFMMLYAPFRITPLPKSEFVLSPTKIVTAILSDYPLPTQGDIIKWMREVGIGRPSTYAKIVEIIMKRRYAIGTKGGALIPTIEGICVYLVLAGTNFTEERFEPDEVLALIQEAFKKKGEIADIIRKALAMARDDISRMVSVRRTKELSDKIRAIEENRVEYTVIVNELLKEVCSIVLKELSKGEEVCRKTQA